MSMNLQSHIFLSMVFKFNENKIIFIIEKAINEDVAKKFNCLNYEDNKSLLNCFRDKDNSE